MRSTIVIGLALILGACAGDSRKFYKDVSQAEYQRDAYECERDMRAGAASFGRGVTAPTYAWQFAVRCMQAKGYRYE